MTVGVYKGTVVVVVVVWRCCSGDCNVVIVIMTVGVSTGTLVVMVVVLWWWCGGASRLLDRGDNTPTEQCPVTHLLRPVAAHLMRADPHLSAAPSPAHPPITLHNVRTHLSPTTTFTHPSLTTTLTHPNTYSSASLNTLCTTTLTHPLPLIMNSLTQHSSPPLSPALLNTHSTSIYSPMNAFTSLIHHTITHHPSESTYSPIPPRPPSPSAHTHLLHSTLTHLCTHLVLTLINHHNALNYYLPHLQSNTTTHPLPMHHLTITTTHSLLSSITISSTQLHLQTPITYHYP